MTRVNRGTMRTYLFVFPTPSLSNFFEQVCLANPEDTLNGRIKAAQKLTVTPWQQIQPLMWLFARSTEKQNITRLEFSPDRNTEVVISIPDHDQIYQVPQRREIRSGANIGYMIDPVTFETREIECLNGLTQH